MCSRQSRKIIWDMISTLFLTLHLSSLLLSLSFSIRKHTSMASSAILANFFEEQSTGNHPQNLSGFSRAFFPNSCIPLAYALSCLSVAWEQVLRTNQMSCHFWTMFENFLSISYHRLRPDISADDQYIQAYCYVSFIRIVAPITVLIHPQLWISLLKTLMIYQPNFHLLLTQQKYRKMQRRLFVVLINLVYIHNTTVS